MAFLNSFLKVVLRIRLIVLERKKDNEIKKYNVLNE